MVVAEDTSVIEMGHGRSHQIIAAFADCSITASALYAVVAHVIRVPTGPAAAISALAAFAGVLVLIPVILLGRFNPKGGSLLNSSPSIVGAVSVAVGLFAVYTVYNGPRIAAYLPMAATIFGSLLVISAAKRIPTASNRESR
jgi:FtsH-binding integral membrane protein